MIIRYIKKNSPKNILEAGGVDRPILQKSNNYIYFGLDLENKPNCHNIYDTFLVQSIEEPLDQKFNLIISKTLLEHVPNNNKSLRVIYDALYNDGVTIHYVPCKFHFYSIILRLIGNKWQKFLIHYIRPEAETVTGYPVFFHKCSAKQIKKLCSDIGFKDITIKPYYRATDYFSFFVPFFIIIAVLENIFKYFNLNLKIKNIL